MLFSRGNIGNTVTTTRFTNYGKLDVDDVDRNDWRMSARRESLEHHWWCVIDREEGFRLEWSSQDNFDFSNSCYGTPSTLSMTLTTSCRENATGLMPVGG